MKINERVQVLHQETVNILRTMQSAKLELTHSSPYFLNNFHKILLLLESSNRNPSHTKQD